MKSLYLLPLLMLMAGCDAVPPKPDLMPQITLLGKRIDCMRAERDEYLKEEEFAVNGWVEAAHGRDTRALADQLDKMRHQFADDDAKCWEASGGAK